MTRTDAAAAQEPSVPQPVPTEDFSKLLEPVRTRSLKRLPRLVSLAVRLVYRAAPRELRRSAALQALAGAAVAVQVLLAREVLQAVVAIANGAPGRRAVPYVVGLAGLTALLSFANLARLEQQRLMGELVARTAVDQVLSVSTRVPLLAFDASAFHNRLLRALVNAGSRPAQMTNGVLGLLSSGLALVGLGVALALIQPLFLAVVVVAYAPLWVATTRMSRIAYDFGVDQTERDRQRTYLSMILSRRDEAAEVRAFRLSRYFQERHGALWQLRIDETRRLVARRMRYGAAGGTVSAVLTGAGTGLLIAFVAQGRLTLAEAGAAAAALLLLGQRLQVLVSSAGALYESSLFIEDFVSFVDVAPALEEARGGRRAPVPFERVEVEDVVFRYPSREAPALDGVSLTLRRGEVVALVGENGSGKSTLAKLLAGLYAPSAGAVRWDDVDLRECDPDSVHDGVAVIFQDFARYALTVQENIGLGRLAALDQPEQVRQAAERAGAASFLEQLPRGYDTLLGAQFFGGSDLSGGQWQRVALARAFLRDAPFLILDEPSAAMDARAEAELFERVRDLYRGRTVLLISHRFSTVRTADRIVVLEHGRVREQGTHDELMTSAGLYAELFTLQAAAYRDDAGGTDVGELGEPVQP